MMAGEGRVALMDFGTGREQCDVRGGPGRYASVPRAGGPVRREEATVQSDIYSIGVLLYFLLTGAYRCPGGDLAGLRAAHERGERRP